MTKLDIQQTIYEVDSVRCYPLSLTSVFQFYYLPIFLLPAVMVSVLLFSAAHAKDSAAGFPPQMTIMALPNSADNDEVNMKELQPKINQVLSQLQNGINSFQDKRKWNNINATWVYLGMTFITAMITLLLGLQGFEGKAAIRIRNTALALSAIVTVLTGVEAFYHFRELGTQYTNTVTQFFGVQARLNYLTAGEQKVSKKKLDELFAQTQEIFAEANKQYNKVGNLGEDGNLKSPEPQPISAQSSSVGTVVGPVERKLR